MTIVKTLLLCWGFCFWASFCVQGEQVKPDGKMQQLLTAYSDQRWGQVNRLLKKVAPSSEQKLIQALYYVYAPRGDKSEGLNKLNILQKDKGLPENIRLQAMLAYARSVEVMQMRPELYPDADSIADPSAIYEEIIKKYPASKEACYGIIYKTRTVLDSPESSKNTITQGFAELEGFLAKPGIRNKGFLGIVHWYAANEYIAVQRNYKSAVTHLVAAEKYGIANPRFLTSIRFSNE